MGRRDGCGSTFAIMARTLIGAGTLEAEQVSWARGQHWLWFMLGAARTLQGHTGFHVSVPGDRDTDLGPSTHRDTWGQ